MKDKKIHEASAIDRDLKVGVRHAVRELTKEMVADGKRLRAENPVAFWVGAPIATFLFFGPVWLGQPIVMIAYFAAKPRAARKFIATARGKKGKTHKEA